MAFADLGSLGAVGSTGNNQTTLDLVTTAAIAAGDFVVVVVAADNIANGGDDNACSGVTLGVGGQALTKGVQIANALAAQAGASCSVWYGVASGALALGGTIRATFGSGTLVDASGLTARKFSIASGNTVSVEGTPGTLVNNTGADPASLNVTTANIACLRIRGIASQVGNNTNLTPTSTWTAWANGNSATTGTTGEICARAEHLISTATGAASDPTYVSAIYASVYVAFKETVVVRTAALSLSEEADALAAASGVVAGGTLASTETDDTLSSAATVEWPPVTGALAVTEADDTLSAAGTVPINTAIAWNSSDHLTTAFSNSDRTATGSGGAARVRSVTRHLAGTSGTGKYYFEVEYTTKPGAFSPNAGLKSITSDLTQFPQLYCGANGEVRSLSLGLLVNLGTTFAQGDTFVFAWDVAADIFWVRKNNGLWNNNASADPATGTGSVSAASLSDEDACIAWFGTSSGYAATIRADAASLVYTAPAGFTSWIGEYLGAAAVTGTLVVTEANDTLSATGVVGDIVTGTLSVTETTDTISAAGTVVSAGGGPWTPDLYAGSYSWFDAQDLATITKTGTEVTAWEDKILGGTISQYNTVGAEYEATGFNGYPGLNFASANGGLERGSGAVPWVGATGGAAFAIIKATAAGGDRTIHGAAYSGGAQFRINGSNQLQMIREFEAGLLNGSTTLVNGNYYIVSWQGDNTGLKFYLNGVLDGTLASDPGFHVGFMLSVGSNSSSHGEVLYGPLGEIIGLNDQPDVETRQKFEGYLAHHWGLTSLLASDHPYKSVAPTDGEAEEITATLSVTEANDTISAAGNTATHRTLTAEAGTCVLAGQAATLRTARRPIAATGTFALAGQAATLRYARKPAAAPGAFTLAGQTAALRTVRVIHSTVTPYTLTGNDATLTKSTAVTHTTMAATAGAVTLNGPAVNLIYSGAGARVMPALTGAFVLSGKAATLLVRQALSAASGTFALSGKAATLRRGRALPAVKGAFVLSGKAATLRYGHVLTTASGTVVLSGKAASLVAGGSKVLLASTGAVAFGGVAATLRFDRALIAESGTLAFAGQPATLRFAHLLAAQTSSIVLTGEWANLYTGEVALSNRTAFVVADNRTAYVVGEDRDAASTDVARMVQVLADSRSVSVSREVRMVFVQAETRTVQAIGQEENDGVSQMVRQGPGRSARLQHRLDSTAHHP